MPIYEYECAKCGTFEAEQSIKDKPLSTCPKCKGKKLRKLISPPAFVFKGSGFYTTDYNRKGSSSDSGGDSKTEKKSEKKPEKKPESPSASS
ncbi:MAG: zinc ribbon domain-containing protein [Bdellovibrionota bacterium]